MPRPAVYALRDPILGYFGYVGSSGNPEERYREHLADGRREARHMAQTDIVELPITDSKSYWLGLILGSDALPELVILEEYGPFRSSNWREREREWHDRLVAEGHPLTNGRGEFSLLGWRRTADRSECPYAALLRAELTVYRQRDLREPGLNPASKRWDAPCVRFQEATALLKQHGLHRRQSAVGRGGPTVATTVTPIQQRLHQLRPPGQLAPLIAAAPASRTDSADNFDAAARAADTSLPESLRYWGA